MVVVENQYFDIKPQKDNNNQLFTDIINTVPVSHPWTDMGHKDNTLNYYGDKDNHRFRKRKGFQKVPLFKWNDNCSVTEETDWQDGEFTDMALFEGHRWFLRVNKDRNKIRLYVQWFVNPEECTNGIYYPITAGQIINVGEYPFAQCAYDKFTPAWGLKYKEQKAFQDGKRILRAIGEGTAVERVLYEKNGKHRITDQYAYIRLNDSGMVVNNAGEVCPSVRSTHKLPDGAVFVTGGLSKQYNYFANPTKCSSVGGAKDTYFENEIKGGITVARGMGNTLSFVTLKGLASISSYGPKNPEDFPGCFDISIFDIPGSSFQNDGLIITGVTTMNDRLVALRSNDTFVISGPGQNQSWFPAGDITDNGDPMIGIHSAPLGVTDIIGYQSHMVLIGPHDTYYFQPSYNNAYGGVFSITDRSGYFSKGSWAVKDGKIFIARSSNDLYILEGQTGYNNAIGWGYTYFTGGIHRHLRPLNKIHDKIYIDLTDNNTYVIINDNTDYTKILIQDRQYNYWYTWIINGCRINHIKHGVYFGDHIYDNSGDTDNGNEIIEIISATWGDETISASKHFVNFKVALGRNSKITDNTTIESSVYSGSEEYRNRMPITTTKYPGLIFDKSVPTGLLFKYDIGKEIHTDGERKDDSLQTEILEYKNFENPLAWSNPMEKTWLAPYASIRESVNQDGEIIKFVVVSRGTDEFEFGGIFLGYHAVDYDYGNIADAVIYPDIPTYQSERASHNLEAVEDPSVLGHF